MKPKDVLPDEKNSVEKGGVTIRKGTLGAFTENIRILESTEPDGPQFQEAASDLLELVPALIELDFFKFYSIKSPRAKALIRKNFPNLLAE